MCSRCSNYIWSYPKCQNASATINTNQASGIVAFWHLDMLLFYKSTNIWTYPDKINALLIIWDVQFLIIVLYIQPIVTDIWITKIRCSHNAPILYYFRWIRNKPFQRLCDSTLAIYLFWWCIEIKRLTLFLWFFSYLSCNKWHYCLKNSFVTIELSVLSRIK